MSCMLAACGLIALMHAGGQYTSDLAKNNKSPFWALHACVRLLTIRNISAWIAPQAGTSDHACIRDHACLHPSFGRW